MAHDLSDYRKSYEKRELLENNCPENPIELFRDWFFVADESEMVEEANAMTIASIGLDGFPKSRVVLLKKYTWEGFIFYTNYNSEKGKAILNNNHVCLSFFWAGLEQQIIIKGKAEKLAENLSDGYFESRPDGSKLGAWASNQSEVVTSRNELDNNLASFEKKFENQEIPRPKHWGGFLVKPVSIEFWQGRPNRMHDRIRYTLQKDFSWKLERLAP
ncbi:Pyridoxamine 5'-phosphate oxidase [Tenacibaculum mesophilum]|uniref:Pyridoxine/pyridoxamine 5'-phosphate oxidase n=2 Tax=Tenacibaculum TaxID=104267 RepID=A0ABN5T4Y1_9FLAO|nr:pyridoxamine 5'-phosphate oxidase [Tenacibaculum mesophilum]GFD81157.1 pyridoxine/pyridoxamine 5'-phosphate oxidase [Tenacibaculum sp. KUL118]GFD95419.1 pyridoxine/pyridoxamine 5'-phosphate oxidase [Alteromonas sp. KUL154]GFE02240.1 pyridoxine/pyridoxamine 5'-phosphate oxidase [Alteromonas sp. KUL156]AZJ32289.1 pyridoxamine 5'-phosphate oxidase [Tenacibaculum mesophilum]QFS27545.1 pyridoxamine 5'-phosphate oxidase [Tenacibaculum mesophilum]